MGVEGTRELLLCCSCHKDWKHFGGLPYTIEIIARCPFNPNEMDAHRIFVASAIFKHGVWGSRLLQEVKQTPATKLHSLHFDKACHRMLVDPNKSELVNK